MTVALNYDIFMLVTDQIDLSPVDCCRFASLSKDCYQFFTSDDVWRKLNPYGLKNEIYKHFQQATDGERGLIKVAWNGKYRGTPIDQLTSNLYAIAGYVVNSQLKQPRLTDLNVAVCAAYHNPSIFKYGVVRIKSNPEFYELCLDHISCDNVSEVLHSDKRFLIQFLARHHQPQRMKAFYRQLPEEIRNDAEIVEAAKLNHTAILPSVDDDDVAAPFMTDEMIIEIAKLLGPEFFRRYPEHVNDKELIVAAVQSPHPSSEWLDVFLPQSPSLLDRSWTNDPDVVAAAVKTDFFNMSWASERLKSDRAFMEQMVSYLHPSDLLSHFHLICPAVFEPMPTLEEYPMLVHTYTSRRLHMPGFRVSSSSEYPELAVIVAAGLDAGVIYGSLPPELLAIKAIAIKVLRKQPEYYYKLKKPLNGDTDVFKALLATKGERTVLHLESLPSNLLEDHELMKSVMSNPKFEVVIEYGNLEEDLMECAFVNSLLTPSIFVRSYLGECPDNFMKYFDLHYHKLSADDKRFLWNDLLLSFGHNRGFICSVVAKHGLARGLGPWLYDHELSILSIQARASTFKYLTEEKQTDPEFVCKMVGLNIEVFQYVDRHTMKYCPNIYETIWKPGKIALLDILRDDAEERYEKISSQMRRLSGISTSESNGQSNKRVRYKFED